MLKTVASLCFKLSCNQLQLPFICVWRYETNKLSVFGAVEMLLLPQCQHANDFVHVSKRPSVEIARNRN